MKKHPWVAPTKLRVYRIDLEKICRDIMLRGSLWTHYWTYFRDVLCENSDSWVQKPGVQIRIVVVPVGGDVGQFEKHTQLWKHFATLGDVCVCVRAVFIIVFLKSFVSCQALAQALLQNSSLTYLNLGSSNIGPKAWCLVKMVSWGERVWRNCRVFSKSSVRFWGSCLAFFLVH